MAFVNRFAQPTEEETEEEQEIVDTPTTTTTPTTPVEKPKFVNRFVNEEGEFNPAPEGSLGPQERTVFDEIQRATPAMTGAMVGGAVGAPLGPVGMLVGSMLGGAIGHYGQMAYEWYTGSDDLPPTAIGQAKEAVLMGLEAGGGEGAGAVVSKTAKAAIKTAWKVRNSNITRKAADAVRNKVVEMAPPGVRPVLEYGQKVNIKQQQQSFANTAQDLAGGVKDNSSPQQRGQIFLDTLKDGKAVQSEVSSLEFSKLDSMGAKALDRTIFPINGQIVRNSIQPARKELQSVATGVVNNQAKEIARNVDNLLNDIPPRLSFAQAHNYRTELQTFVEYSQELGNNKLASTLKDLQKGIGNAMEQRASTLGIGPQYKLANKPWEEGVEAVTNEFISTLMRTDPENIGRVLFSQGSRQDILKAKTLLGEAAKRNPNINPEIIMSKMESGYFRDVFSEAIEEGTGAFRLDRVVEIMNNPETKRRLRVALGDRYSEVEKFVNNLQRHYRTPTDTLIQAGGLLGFITGKVDPTTAVALLASPIVRRGLSYTSKVAVRGIETLAEEAMPVEILSRMIADKEALTTINKLMSTKPGTPNAARLMGQFTTHLNDAIEDIITESEAFRQKSKTPGAFVNRFSEVVEPESVSPESASARNDPVEDTGRAYMTPELEWLDKYQKANPGVSRAQAIAEGQRQGVLPKNYKDTSLGIRSNNPGNIRVSSNNWKGKDKDHKGPFEVFETPELGIRAMVVLLRNYSSMHGLNTVGQIISRWAPRNENDTDSYIKTVARRMGVKPNERLNLNDPKIMRELIKAIIYVENGSNPYDDKLVDKGIRMASK